MIQRLLPTLFEDELLLAVGKPAGIPAGRAQKHAQPGIAEILTDSHHLSQTLEPANRLGHFESGALILGKTAESTRHFREELRNGRVEQRWVAVLTSRLTERRLDLDPTAGASRGRSGKRAGIGKRPPDRRRHSSVQLIRHGPDRSLIECRTTAPNTHALRAQLRAAGLRLLGDTVHGSRRTAGSPQRTCLHLSHVTFSHPDGRRVTVRCPVPEEDVRAALAGDANPIRPVRAALVKRAPCLSWTDTDSFRLLCDHGEGTDGLAADKLGPVAFLQRSKEPRGNGHRVVKTLANWYRDTLDLDAVFVKRLYKPARHAGAALQTDAPIAGRPGAGPLVATEHGLKFLIRPDQGLSTGLFLDHRDNRQRLRGMAQDKDVLNLFCHTCSFSVAAAAGGARTTVSVDLTPKYLDWGRENFALNGLDPSPHDFVQSDALEYLKFARRKSRAFDVIILDPPSFAHGRKRGRDFSIERDLSALVSAAAQVLNREGVMMVSTNVRRMSLKGLIDRVRAGAAGRRHRILAKPPLPIDFAPDPAHAKTVFVRFE